MTSLAVMETGLSFSEEDGNAPGGASAMVEEKQS